MLENENEKLLPQNGTSCSDSLGIPLTANGETSLMPPNLEVWTKPRIELIRWFEINAPVVVAPYRLAISLLYADNFSGVAFFVSHVMREIADSLGEIVSGRVFSDQTQYPNKLAEVRKWWPSPDQLALGAQSPASPANGPIREISISMEAFQLLDPLIQTAAVVRGQSIKAIRSYEALNRSSSCADEAGLLLDRLRGERNWFVSHTHFPKFAPASDLSRKDLCQHVTRFEAIIHSLVGKFFTAVGQIGGFLAEANQKPFTIPTNEQIEAVASTVHSPEQVRLFFGGLENPQWIEGLYNRKYFTFLPFPEQSEQGTRHPSWPDSQYLKRMAKHKPAQVSKIMRLLHCENCSVNHDIISAACDMPAKQAAELVPQLCKIFLTGMHGFDMLDLVKICVCLAKGGKTNEAFTLAKCLFRDHSEGGHQHRHSDDYWYRKAMALAIPELVPSLQKPFLHGLCDWLNGSINGSKRRYGMEDYSWSWRTAIEEHPENHNYDLAGSLAGFLRGAFELALRSGLVTLQEACDMLGVFQYSIFKRLEIHLLRLFSRQAPECADACVMQYDIFDDYRLKHEYSLLVASRWVVLTDEQRKQWLEWVETGSEKAVCGDVADQENGRHKQWWQLEKLHWVRNQLDQHWRSYYNHLYVALGKPDMDVKNLKRKSRWGYESPVPLNDLQARGFAGTVKYISTWSPKHSNDPWSPSVAGLAEVFNQYVATDPIAFSRESGMLRGCYAIYINSLLNSMASAIKNKIQIDLGQIISLCQWVLQQPVESTVAGAESMERRWQTVRAKVIALLREVFQSDVPLSHRELLWDTLTELLDEPAQPCFDVENLRTADYLLLCANATRSQAMLAVFDYARWVADHIARNMESGIRVEDGFDRNLPEVKKVLEAKLQETGMEGVVVRSAFGWNTALIRWIDEPWLRDKVDAIFDLDGLEAAPIDYRGWAAWNTFLYTTSPHAVFFNMLKKQYRYVATQMANDDEAEESYDKPLDKLGEHIIILYARGDIDISDEILKQFFTSHAKHWRRNAMAFLGRSLYQRKDGIPEVTTKRVIKLWECYWDGPGKKDAVSAPKSDAFGWYFSSGLFDPQWSLKQLEAFVEVAPMPEPGIFIAEQMAKIAEADLQRCIRILHLLVNGDTDGWRIDTLVEPAKIILSKAMKADARSRDEAEQMIDVFGRRGFTGFGDLLSLVGDAAHDLQ